MKVYLSPSGGLNVAGAAIALRDARPVFNGKEQDATAQVIEDNPDRVEVLYSLQAADGRAGLRVAAEREGDESWVLTYMVEGLDSALPLDSFGLAFQQVENLDLFLRQGYTSWDGSAFVASESLADGPRTGYAMTALRAPAGEVSMVLGVERHDRFQHTFTFGLKGGEVTLTLATLWDRKTGAPGAPAMSERLLIFDHWGGVEEALRAWARRVAHAAPVSPRVSAPPILGWCSWYNLYATITEENILEHLRHATEVSRRERLPMRVFQIDDGFTPEMGDWLECRPQFAHGMKPLLDEIRAAGFVPGLWIAPFMVGNRSHLYRDHPDWVVQDAEASGPLVQTRFYGEFRWHKRSEEYYILDTTHPQAFEYLRQVFHTWRHEWGCEYFKTDFMYFGCANGPDRAQWHSPGRTRIETWRQTAEMIREEIGDSLWLGCGAPLFASVGFVDGIRIGKDVGVQWSSEDPLAPQSGQSLLSDLAHRNFGNHILWQADPDCILLRDRFHYLSDAEVRSLALYAAMAGGVRMTSDDLAELSPERLALWKLILSVAPRACNLPQLGRRPAGLPTDSVIVQVREPAGAGGIGAVLLFNSGEQAAACSYPLDALGLPSPAFLCDWRSGRASPQAVSGFSVMVPPHDSLLLFVGATHFSTAPQFLP